MQDRASLLTQSDVIWSRCRIQAAGSRPPIIRSQRRIQSPRTPLSSMKPDTMSLRPPAQLALRSDVCALLCFRSAFLYSWTLCQIEAAWPFKGLSRLGSAGRGWIRQWRRQTWCFTVSNKHCCLRVCKNRRRPTAISRARAPPSRLWMERRIVRTLYTADHFSCTWYRRRKHTPLAQVIR